MRFSIPIPFASLREPSSILLPEIPPDEWQQSFAVQANLAKKSADGQKFLLTKHPLGGFPNKRWRPLADLTQGCRCFNHSFSFRFET